MLDGLNTLIAFALIFTVVSLLITVLVQLLSALLNLRGRNLAAGVAETFKTISGTTDAQVKGWFNMLWNGGESNDPARALANQVLKNSLISDSRFLGASRPASAVRPQELFDLLYRIAEGKTPESLEVRKNVRELLQGLGLLDELKYGQAELAAARALVPNLTLAIKSIISETEQNALKEAMLDLPRDDGGWLQLTRSRVADWRTRMQVVLTQMAASPAKQTLEDAFAALAQKLVQLPEKIELVRDAERVKAAYQKFEQWFETGQDRAQEWFKAQTKTVSMILAFAAALVLQLDAFEIYHQISTNRELREKLVAEAEVVQTQAKTLLEDNHDVLQTAFEAWQAQLPADAALSSVKGLKAEPGDTRGSFIARVRAALMQAAAPTPRVPSATEAQINASIDRLAASIDDTAKKEIERLTKDYKDLSGTLEKTGFELFPKTGWRWTREKAAEENEKAAANTNAKPPETLHERPIPWHLYWPHLFGMFCSALLLSLGAPFWYNLLKTLSSLRSAVADSISEEDKIQQTKGKSAKDGTPPPSVTTSR